MFSFSDSNLTVIVLTAGSATRMGDYCLDVPKSLLPVAGYPFLVWLLSWLSKYDFEIFIVTCHLSEKIREFTADNFPQSNIKLIKLETLLETAGTIKNAARYVSSRYVLVVNGDTIVSFEINDALAFHLSHGLPVTQIISAESNQNKGAIKTDETGKIILFEEGKPADRAFSGDSTRFSSTGCYVFDTDFVLNNFPESGSLERQVMPAIIQEKIVMGYGISGEVYDFGTPERYEAVKNNYKKLVETYGLPII